MRPKQLKHNLHVEDKCGSPKLHHTSQQLQVVAENVSAIVVDVPDQAIRKVDDSE